MTEAQTDMQQAVGTGLAGDAPVRRRAGGRARDKAAVPARRAPADPPAAGGLARERRARLEAERQLARSREEIRLLNRELTRQALRQSLDRELPASGLPPSGPTACAPAPPGPGQPSPDASGAHRTGLRVPDDAPRRASLSGVGGAVAGSGAAGAPYPVGAAASGPADAGAGPVRRAGARSDAARAMAGGSDAVPCPPPVDGGGLAALSVSALDLDGVRAGPALDGAGLWRGISAARLGAALFDGAGVLLAANALWLRPFAGLAGIRPGIRIDALLDLALAEGVFDTGRSDPALWRQRALARWSGGPPPPVRLRLWSGCVVRMVDCRLPGGGQLSLAVDITRDRARMPARGAPGLAVAAE